MTIRPPLAALVILSAAILRPAEEGRPSRPTRETTTMAVSETDARILPPLPEPLERVRAEAPSVPLAEGVSADPPPPRLHVDDEDLSRLLRGEKVEDVPRLGETAARRADVAGALAGVVASDAPIQTRYEAYRALAFAGRESLVRGEAIADLRREIEGSSQAHR